MAESPVLEDNPKAGGNALERLSSFRIPLTLETALYAAVLLAAFGLRFWDLGTRALHHDESIHAQWSWGLLQGNYHHSPIFHGPLYYHVQALVFLVFGANDYTSRVSAALFGMAMVAVIVMAMVGGGIGGAGRRGQAERRRSGEGGQGDEARRGDAERIVGPAGRGGRGRACEARNDHDHDSCDEPCDWDTDSAADNHRSPERP